MTLLLGCNRKARTDSVAAACFGMVLLGFFGGASLAVAAPAQTTLKVTDYNAKGDAIQLYVNTVSNSVVVTTTNTFSSSDIGKTIEVFGVGKKTYGMNSYGILTNGWQDVIATIANVVDATNLYLNVLPQDGPTNYIPSRTMQAWATIGTDNTLAFSNCIAAAPANATIYIPRGTYLMMPRRRSNGLDGYAFCAIAINRGGLRFLGEDRGNTILLSRGAWQSYHGYIDGSYPFRGFLFECVAPVTNDLPLVFENLTMDGGVQQGNLSVHGIQCNKVDGLGWDEQHGAYLTFDTVNGGGTASLQVFTNVNVLHWRGEALKSIDQNTNGTIDIQNCLFADICATALNIYPRWNVRNNVFSNCWQITEYYQQFYRGTAYFCDNLITNAPELVTYNSSYIGNAVSINGGIWTASPLVIRGNKLMNANGYGMNTFITTPAANVSFTDNEIVCPPFSQVFSLGAPGAQGTDCSSNILVSGNSIVCPGTLTSAFGLGDGGIQAVYNLTICSNTVTAPGGIQHLTWGNRVSKNIRFFNNDASSSGGANIQTGVPGPDYSPFFLFETNNSYKPPELFLSSAVTTLVSYAWGPISYLDCVKSGNVFMMEDSTSNQIPAGASMQIDNRKNRWSRNGWGGGDMSGDVIIYPSQKPGTAPMKLANGSQLTFHWTGSQWSTNENRSNPLLPASNLRRTVNGTVVQ